jgi:ATP-binding cassette subfamily A (ABC1) protein 3
MRNLIRLKSLIAFPPWFEMPFLANMDLRPFARQTWALSKKNLRIVIVRCWLSTLIRALILPILFLTLLLEIPNLARSRNVLGVAQPAPLRSLADSMIGDKKLAIVTLGNLGSGYPPAIDRLTRSLNADDVVHLDNEDQIRDACQVDYHGNSQCHAVVTFRDSPTSGRVNATWNYTIKADPSRTPSGIVDVFNRDGSIEGFYLPLQVSIDNAITNSSAIPETFSYAYGDQAIYNRDAKRSFLGFAASILGFVFVLTMIPVSHHVSSLMSSERESGLSQLMDGMGGDLEWARVMSFAITFDMLYLPLWIILGCRKHVSPPSSSSCIP